METLWGTDGLLALAEESWGWELAGEEAEEEQESWTKHGTILDSAHLTQDEILLRGCHQPHWFVLVCFGLFCSSKPEGEGRCAVEIFKLLLFSNWVRGNVCLISYWDVLYLQAKELLFLLCWLLTCKIAVFILLFWQTERLNSFPKGWAHRVELLFPWADSFKDVKALFQPKNDRCPEHNVQVWDDSAQGSSRHKPLTVSVGVVD